MQILATVNRTTGYAIAGYVSAVVGRQRAKALTFGVEAGLLVGIVTAVVNACMPLIEWTAEHFPARRMGVVGICFILGGRVQSVQY